jgi:LmbE family N-acetylglucosaminyl deacetylase
MKFRKPTADFYIPDGATEEEALGRVTHLAVGAHQDDVEFMAAHGVLACFGHRDLGFASVTCTNGAGSPRVGPYASVSDADMCRIRRGEQRAAGALGHYSFVAQLDYSSAEAKDPAGTDLVDDLAALLQATHPLVVYTHNPADKHETHVAIMATVLRAIRSLPREARPGQLLGCEVWRDLDWLSDMEKVVLDVSAHQNLQTALSGVYDSQIVGGKRYDLAAMGRRRANATFLESHAADRMEMASFAMDLTPLAADETRDPVAFVQAAIDRFAADVRDKLSRRLGRPSPE